jgi:uncharacterized protein with PQ loop repeat
VTALFIFSIFQIIGGAILAVGYPSQFMKLLKRKSSHDFSLFWVGTIFVGITFMEVYAVWLFIGSGLPALAFLITNSIAMLFSGTLFGMVMHYRK